MFPRMLATILTHGAILEKKSELKSAARTIFHGLSNSFDLVQGYATLFQDRYWKGYLLSKAKMRSGGRVLDLGCGTGVLEQHLNGNGYSVTGVDLSEAMLRIARRKDIECVDSLLLSDAESLPFGDESFDAVLSCGVVKYCALGELVAEVHRVLKPNSPFVFYDFTRPSGLFAPLYGLYVYGILRTLGILLEHYGSEISHTFSKLPRIIASTSWDERMMEVLSREEFVGIGNRRLSRGIVTMFWATKG